MSTLSSSQALIFDADDTLWENNILFERVISDYIDWLAYPSMTHAEVRAVLDDVERANAATLGYGTKMLLLSLRDCFARLHGRVATEPEQVEIDRLAAVLAHETVELMPGVTETLGQLRRRHELLLLTKGDRDEQQLKLDVSGLAENFAHVEIVAEKTVDTYRDLVSRRGLNPDHTWMIGNSPRSDVIPARAAGLRAVFIPHPHTWALEHAEVDATDQGVLTLRTVVDLLDHF